MSRRYQPKAQEKKKVLDGRKGQKCLPIRTMMMVYILYVCAGVCKRKKKRYNNSVILEMSVVEDE